MVDASLQIMGRLSSHFAARGSAARGRKEPQLHDRDSRHVIHSPYSLLSTQRSITELHQRL